ncbi:MAG: hypothetical protein OXM61_22675 [Candidatus Poribacteria bacterium]|nr:hypothetical protein [Candidatus Poribacteria bacterium]
MFIEKCYPPPLEFRRNGIEDLTYRPYQINAMNAPINAMNHGECQKRIRL